MSSKESNLNFAVVPQNFLEKMEAEIIEMKSILRAKSESEINSQWIESVRIPKILGISRKTWQSYRDKKLIPFSQIGSKIYVKRADLEKFMSDHYIDKIR
jgi:ACT domain-containing protein